jgi:hypothetical protein
MFGGGEEERRELLEKAKEIRQRLREFEQMRDFTRDDLEEAVGKWKETMEAIWNGEGRKFVCCDVRFEVITRIGDEKSEPVTFRSEREAEGARRPRRRIAGWNPLADLPQDDNFDRIGVVPSSDYRSHISGFTAGFDRNDFSSQPYEQNMWGRWQGIPREDQSEESWRRMAAHEMGHEMGLKDQYTDRKRRDGSTVSVPKKGRRSDLMGNSRTGRPRPEDISKILRKRGIRCPGECCFEGARFEERPDPDTRDMRPREERPREAFD